MYFQSLGSTNEEQKAQLIKLEKEIRFAAQQSEGIARDLSENEIAAALAWIFAVGAPTWPAASTPQTFNFAAIPSKPSDMEWAEFSRRVYDNGERSPEEFVIEGQCEGDGVPAFYVDAIFGRQVSLCLAQFSSSEEFAAAFVEFFFKGSENLKIAAKEGDAGRLAYALLSAGVYGNMPFSPTAYLEWEQASNGLVKGGFDAWAAVRSGGPPPRATWDVKTAPAFYYEQSRGVVYSAINIASFIAEQMVWAHPRDTMFSAEDLAKIVAVSRMISNWGSMQGVQTYNFVRLQTGAGIDQCGQASPSIWAPEAEQCLHIFPGPWAGGGAAVNALLSAPLTLQKILEGDAGKISDLILTSGTLGEKLKANPVEGWETVAQALVIANDQAATEIGAKPGAMAITAWRPDYVKEANGTSPPQPTETKSGVTVAAPSNTLAYVLVGTAVAAAGAYWWMSSKKRAS